MGTAYQQSTSEFSNNTTRTSPVLPEQLVQKEAGDTQRNLRLVKIFVQIGESTKSSHLQSEPTCPRISLIFNISEGTVR
jgi:hypothetical protein